MNDSQEPVYTSSTKGVTFWGKEVTTEFGRRFEIQSGSQMVADWEIVPSAPEYVRKQRKWMKDWGYLSDQGDHYVLLRPWKFHSKTAAHDVFAGNHESGPEWFKRIT
jgi:hypothetical protein